MATDRINNLLPEVARMLDDGASIGEVSRTLGISRQTINRYLPGRSQWTVRDGGLFAAACREMRRATGLKVWDVVRDA